MRRRNEFIKISSIIAATVFAINIGFSAEVVRATEITSGNPSVKMSLKQGYNADIVVTVGKSTVDVAQFQKDLTAKLRAKGLDSGRVKISALSDQEVSATEENSEDEFTWQTYDHLNIWQGEDPYPSPDTALSRKQHIIVNGKNMTFYGYGQSGYKDFMFMPNDLASKKTFNFDINESGIQYHSMEGGGFLFNTQIVNGTLSGYAILFVSSGINLYEISGVNVSKFHEGTLGGSMSSMTGIKVLKSFTKASGSSHTIKIEATPTTINMWDNGAKTIDNYSLASTYGNGFGPIASYTPHGCNILSYFKFSNLKMSTMATTKFKDAIKKPDWRAASKRFIVNLEDTVDADFDTPATLGEILLRMSNEEIHYLAFGTDTNETQAETFIKKNDNRGLFENKTDYENSVEKMAQYIYDNLQPAGNETTTYLVAGRPLDIDVDPGEYKSNTITEQYPTGKWRLSHNEKYFENDKGKAEWDNQYLDSISNVKFDKPGEYLTTFEDVAVDPQKIYVHRQPVASFDESISYANNQYNATITGKSYDEDLMSQADKGIKEEEWKWKEVDDLDWTDGKLDPSKMQTSKYYMVQLRVKDYQDTWSEPEVKYISTTPDPTQKPIADFNVSSTMIYTEETTGASITIDDSSYDPHGNAIVDKKWRVIKDGTEIYNASTPMTDFSGQSAGEYTIELTVSNGQQWSTAFSRTITIVEPVKNLAATAGDGEADLTFSPMTGATNIVLEQSTDGINYTPTTSSAISIDKVEDGEITETTTALKVKGLTNGLQYRFRLVATDGIRNGQSNIATAMPKRPIDDLEAVSGDKQVTLNFAALKGATNVIVQQSTDGVNYTNSTTGSAISDGTIDGAIKSLVVTGLTNGQEYKFRLIVTGGAHEGTSNVAKATPTARITDLYAVGKDKEVYLTFTPPTGATSVVLEQSIDGINFTVTTASSIVILGQSTTGSAVTTDSAITTSSSITTTGAITAGTNSIKVIGLTNNQLYSFRLVITGGVYEGISNTATATPMANHMPTSDLVAIAGDGQVTLKFTAPSGAESVVIEQSIDGISYTPANTGVLTENSTSAIVTGLTNGQQYKFRLVVTGGIHEGTSNTVTAKPLGKITDLVASAGDEQVGLRFTAPTGATSVRVEQSLDGVNYTTAATNALTETSTSTVVTGLTNGKEYSFRLVVVGGSYEGTSNIATGTPRRSSSGSGSSTNTVITGSSNPGDTKKDETKVSDNVKDVISSEINLRKLGNQVSEAVKSKIVSEVKTKVTQSLDELKVDNLDTALNSAKGALTISLGATLANIDKEINKIIDSNVGTSGVSGNQSKYELKMSIIEEATNTKVFEKSDITSEDENIDVDSLKDYTPYIVRVEIIVDGQVVGTREKTIVTLDRTAPNITNVQIGNDGKVQIEASDNFKLNEKPFKFIITE